MKVTKIISVVLIMLFLNPFLYAAYKQIESVKEKKVVEEQILITYTKISDEFGKLNIEGVLKYFSDSEEMVKISNGKVLRGKRELRDNWQKMLCNIKDLTIEIKNVEYHHISEKVVWTVADEYITHGGSTHHAVVSNIFILEDSVWKILQDHTTYISEMK